MKKLIKGIVEFRDKVRPSYRETFARLALGQAPDTLFIACSDSRVVPNLFASTDPGDLFVVRNVGNLVPPCGESGHSSADESEAAAIEFALVNLNVSDIIVCGHSECGAMTALVQGRESVGSPNLRAWLRHGEAALASDLRLAAGLSTHNRVSQANVLEQLRHLESYPLVKDRIKAGALMLHGWWFDIAAADVYRFEPGARRFVLIDEDGATRISAYLSEESRRK